MQYPFGENKGVALEQCSDKDLRYLVKYYNSPDKEGKSRLAGKFGPGNLAMLTEVKKILGMREGGTKQSPSLSMEEIVHQGKTFAPAAPANGQTVEILKSVDKSLKELVQLFQTNFGNQRTVSVEDTSFTPEEIE